jgi:hypothetical protein
MDPGGSGGGPATAVHGGQVVDPGGSADGQPQPAVEAAAADALARSLLPIIHHPAIAYNLPVMDVQRY